MPTDLILSYRAEIGAELPTLRSEMRTLEQKAKNLSEQQIDKSRLDPGMSDGANGFSMRAIPYPGVPKFSEEANACQSQSRLSVEMINTQLEIPNVHFGNRFTEVTRAEPVFATGTGTNFGAFEAFDPLNNPPPVLDETFSSWTTLLPPSDPCYANTLSPDAQFEQFLTNLE